MIYSGISLDCFSKKVFADDSVFASLKSLYEFQIWCGLKKLWCSFRFLGRGSNFRVIIIFRIIFSSSKGGSFFTYAMHVLCTPRKAEIMFFKLIFCLRKIRKKGFSLSEKYYFFPAQKLIKILLFLGPMHTQEARNNVFQSGGKFGKKGFAVGKVLFFRAQK